MESKSFPSNFYIAGRYAKHREQDYLRYGKRGITCFTKSIELQ